MTAARELLLERPVYGGDCVAHLPVVGNKPGKAVFVPFGLPGERVVASFIEGKKNFAKAEIVEVLSSSEDRVVAPCSYFGGCGGCQYQHATYAVQLAMKEEILRETLSRAGLTVPLEMSVLSDEPFGYRNRIRLAVLHPDGASGEGHGLAYRGRRSHELVAVEECPIAAPGLFIAAQKIAEFLSSHPGPVDITEIELFANQDGSQMLISLFCERDPDQDATGWVAELCGSLPEGTGVRLQISDGSFSPHIFANAGEASLEYTVAGFAYRVDHGAFFQVNRQIVDRFLNEVLKTAIGAAQSRGTAWDLYAGVGLFARQLGDSFARVVAVESAGASYAALQHNLAGRSAEAVCSTTLEYLRRNRELRESRPDLIVLDPPRAGLGAETTTLLNAIKAPAIVYVSCDPTSLARDLRALTLEGYRVDSITMVDMFPQTFHLETIACLSRR